MENKKLYPWVVVGLLWVVALLNYMDRQMLSTMQEAMKADIAELNKAEAFGALMAIFLWIYGFMSPVAGMIAVPENCRGKGVATVLLNAVIEKAKGMGLPAVGLLVDTGNPKAEKLYGRVGFKFVGNNTWGGHPMKHLQYVIN